MSARVALFIAAISLATAHAAHAQPAPATPRWQFLITNGTLTPTGERQKTVKRGNLTAAQVSVGVSTRWLIVGTAGWGRTRAVSNGDAKLDVFTYDLGTEVRPLASAVGRRVTLKPFAGLGLGGRTDNYRHLPLAATHHVNGYASVGAEVGIRHARLRLEVRDYVAALKPVNGDGRTRARNDVMVVAGLRVGR